MDKNKINYKNSIVRIFTITPNKRLRFLGLGVLLFSGVIVAQKKNDSIEKDFESVKRINQIYQYFIDFPFLEPNQLLKITPIIKESKNKYHLYLFELMPPFPKNVNFCKISRSQNTNVHKVTTIEAYDGNVNHIKIYSDLNTLREKDKICIESIEKLPKHRKNFFSCPSFTDRDELLGFIDYQEKEDGELQTIDCLYKNNAVLKRKPIRRHILSFLKDLPPIQAVLRIISLILVMLSFLANIFGVITYINPTYLSPMSSKINIVVLPFATEKCNLFNPQRIEREIPTQMATLIKEESNNEDIIVDVRDPSIYPFLPFRFSEFTAEKAAQENNAQIVIYGNIICKKNNDAIVQTKLYISPENFGDALELIGENVAGQLDFAQITIYGGDQFAGNAYLAQQKELRERIQIYSLIIYGIGSYINQEPESAIDYFSKALDNELWTNENGKETLYLLLGNAYQRKATELFLQEKYNDIPLLLHEAENYYDLANSYSNSNGKGDYARAFIGLSGVNQIKSILPAKKMDNEEQIDSIYLNNAIIDLEKASESTNKSITADINVKINYGYAQISLINFLQNRDITEISNAEDYYDEVIDAYHGGRNSRISELVALAYKGKAAIYKNTDQKKAISYLDLAYSIARNRSLKAQILVIEGDYLLEYGNVQMALEKYQSAIDMKYFLKKVISESEMERIEELINSLPVEE